MSKIGIYYGSTGGVNEGIANKIAQKLGVAGSDVHNIANYDENEFKSYDLLLLGSSTWGDGDLQDDWFDPIDKIKALDLKGKKVALFSNGDSAGYTDTFCGALKFLYEATTAAGAQVLEGVSTDGYEVGASEGVKDGQFLGLAIDEDNESDKTDERIDAWVEKVKAFL